MNDYLKYAGIILGLALIQKTLIWLIAVTEFKITPDIVLIGVVYIGIRKGKITGTVGGFLAGMLMDLFSFSFLGLTALSKCVAGFFSGYFNAEGKIDRNSSSYNFVVIVFFASFINNFIYYFDEHCSKGAHELMISVTDEAGNKTQQSFNFIKE